MPHTAPPAVGIPGIAGYKVPVDMHDGLAGIPADIYPEIVPRGMVSLLENGFELPREIEECSLLFPRGLEEIGDMPEGDDEHMAFADGIDIVHCKGKLVLYDAPFTDFIGTERAVHDRRR